jgi:hypothetical protein
MSYARAGLIAIALTSACDWAPPYCEGDWARSPPEAEPARSARTTVAQVLPAESTAVDILFVIDDSISMTDEQQQLGIWSSKLFEVLGPTGELPDLHIGVTSSSVAIDGNVQCRNGLGGTLLGGFLVDVATASGERERNYKGTLTEAFAKLARVGDMGCGLEQPFKAARLALMSSKGFLRDDALLLVVFVTDEDDCSAKSPALFADAAADGCSELGTNTDFRCFEHGVRCYDGKGSRELGERTNCHADEDSPYVESVKAVATDLKRLKTNPAQVVVAAIYGKPNGVNVVENESYPNATVPRLAATCGGGAKQGIGAAPGIRVNALLAEFGGRASQSSICESELSWAMRDVGLVTRAAATRSRCLRGAVRDTKSCRVEGITDEGTPRERRVEVPPCESAESRRCYTIGNDATCDSKLAFDFAGTAADETLTVSCDVD